MKRGEGRPEFPIPSEALALRSQLSATPQEAIRYMASMCS